MDEERVLLFRPGDAPRPETALPPGGGSQKLLILPILFIK
jgi:hypothetical protein